MKKFIICFSASLAMLLSSYATAATSPLIESLLEYEAITAAIGAPSFDVIPQDEFIVDIRRITKPINVVGEVQYLIYTRSIDPSACCVRYIATLNIVLNPGVGPNIITVESIERV